MNFGVTIPALAREVLDTDATGYGFLMTATGIGSLTAALLIAFSGRSRPVVVPLGALILGAALVAAAFIDVYAFALVAMLFVGLRCHRDGRDRQHDDPAGRPGRAARAG